MLQAGRSRVRFPMLLDFSIDLILPSRDRAVGIMTSYGLNNQEVGVRVPAGSRILSFPRRPDRLWGSHYMLSNGYHGLYPPVVARPGHEADHSPPTSAEAKKMWIYTPNLPTRLHGVVLN
jgi:hypothetical protein